MLPLGMVEPGVEALAALLAFGQMLEQDAAGDVAGIVDREPHQARYLLRLAEEMLRGLGEAFALERDDALVALAGHRLVEGDGEIALAEQGEQRRQAGSAASRCASKRT